jgi:TRAP-type transport system periplasmic protein
MTTAAVPTRRRVVATMIATPLVLRAGFARAATVLKIAHPAPGGTIEQGDIRDRMSLKFATDIAISTRGEVTAQVYPAQSLVKQQAQYSALRKGAVEMGMVPVSYAGGESPELNLALMPAIVSSYDEAYGWKDKPIGRELTAFLESRGLVTVAWLWLKGGIAAKAKAVVDPDDVKGLKLRGGSREVDMMLKQAGASVLSLPSAEIYQAMQTGACDGAITSSSSIQSFRLAEVSRFLTMGQRSFWFIYGPMLMSKIVFDTMPKAHRDAIMEVGAALEPFGRAGAEAEDAVTATAYRKAGLVVAEIDDTVMAKWRDLARTTAWSDYAAKSDNCARLLKLAIAAST